MDDSDRLKELYAGVAVHATANREHMAALELLAVIMVADSTLDEDEIVTLCNSAPTGGSDFTFEEYLARRSPRPALSVPGRPRRLVDDIDGRISSRAAQGAVLRRPPDVRRRRANEVESELLADIAVRFG